MIKAGIDQIQRRRFATQQFFQKRGHGGVRPEAVTDPQQFLPAIKQSIACSFKRDVLRPVQNFKSIIREPGAVMRLFTLSFEAAETADDDLFAQDDACIRCENDIW
jgi:hypothetical protein